MRRTLPLLLVFLALAVAARLTNPTFHVESKPEVDFKKYAPWSIDGVRPGMSLQEASTKWQTLLLIYRANFFGEEMSLFRRQNENGYISRGYIVVDKEKQIVQVEGPALEKDGIALAEMPFTDEDVSNVIENRCRATDIWVHQHKILMKEHPISIRGPVAAQAILGEDPEWMALCYRIDDLGVCLEGLDHVSSLIPDAKRRLGRYASTTDELPAYPKDRGLMSVLVCPLGGTYQLHGPTLTCLSHPDGPISVTRTERTITFWNGAPESADGFPLE
jgi:hypothetical protein